MRHQEILLAPGTEQPEWGSESGRWVVASKLYGVNATIIIFVFFVVLAAERPNSEYTTTTTRTLPFPLTHTHACTHKQTHTHAHEHTRARTHKHPYSLFLYTHALPPFSSQNKWVPRRSDNNPKTIEQIHQEVQQEEQEKILQMTSSCPPPPPPAHLRNRHSLHRGSDSSGSNDWTFCSRGIGGSGGAGGVSGGRYIPKTPIDHSKLKFDKLVESDFKLEPNRVNWTAGSNNNSLPNFQHLTSASRNSSMESEKLSAANSNRLREAELKLGWFLLVGSFRLVCAWEINFWGCGTGCMWL